MQRAAMAPTPAPYYSKGQGTLLFYSSGGPGACRGLPPAYPLPPTIKGKGKGLPVPPIIYKGG